MTSVVRVMAAVCAMEALLDILHSGIAKVNYILQEGNKSPHHGYFKGYFQYFKGICLGPITWPWNVYEGLLKTLNSDVKRSRKWSGRTFAALTV